MEEHHLRVPRTARYYTLGTRASAREAWVVLHGYGQLARFFLRGFEGVEEGRWIVAPEGLSRFYLNDDHSRVGATWMTREDREHEMADQLSYLDALVEATAAGLPVKVLGFSQGVATATRWALSGRTAITRLVLWGGSLPPEAELWKQAGRLHATPVDLVHGEQDTLVPADVLVQSEARLRDAGVVHATHRHAGGHALDTLLLKRLMLA
ncbi:MAG TPA: dienelactone hydrolase family protein [Flavobacteriales bacterium]|nr:dienelactone hydrolase family protein [Flavobacteriales bacterium]